MERWRSFFEKSRADIWTVIHQAITVAAIDYPKDFRERRDQIAETLFDRNLLQQQVKDEPSLICKGGEGRTSGPTHLLEAPTNAGDVAVCRQLHDDAEALSDELEEEALLLRDLHYIKGTLADVDQHENVILEALQRLQYMQITVDNLKATEIGKLVRSLKKHPSKKVQAFAKELMRQWKILIDDWIISVKDVTTAATTEDYGHGVGLLAPPLDEGALLVARAPIADLSQLFSFVDGEDLCIYSTGIKGSEIPSNSIEPSVKDNSSYLYRSQSGSMLTEISEFDSKASVNCPWGLTTPEERGSATRDMYPPSGKLEKEEAVLKGQVSHHGKSHIDAGVKMSKSVTNGIGPGRPYNEISKEKPVSGLVSWRDESHKSVTMHARNVGRSCATVKPTTDYDDLNQKSCKIQIDQKLEIAKRKLHQGYQQAENAKKQRTVQILESSELPNIRQLGKAKLNAQVHNKEHSNVGHGRKAKMIPPLHNREVSRVKMNVPVLNKVGVQSGQWSQSRKFT